MFCTLHNNLFEIILLCVFCVTTIFQLYFYLHIFRKSAFHKSTKNNLSYTPPVSVIIAAKNEEKNLDKNLKLILDQDYPDFELIIINDASTDSSKEIISKYKQNYSNIISLDIEESKGKKDALSLGINKAQNEYLVFIDADCYPGSRYWLKSMVSEFEDKSIEIVLGYGSYKRTKGFLNGYICYDSFFIALQYFGAALIGHAYMGVGRNLAYTKNLWIKTNGFESHKNISSGDDDLFVIEAGTSKNIAVIYDDSSKTVSETESSFIGFVNQKTRHYSVVNRYRPKDKFFSGGEMVSRALFYLCFIYGIIFINPLFFILVFFIRLSVQLIDIYKFSAKLNEKYNFYFCVFFDIFAVFIIGYLWTIKVFSPKKYQNVAK